MKRRANSLSQSPEKSRLENSLRSLQLFIGSRISHVAIIRLH